MSLMLRGLCNCGYLFRACDYKGTTDEENRREQKNCRDEMSKNWYRPLLLFHLWTNVKWRRNINLLRKLDLSFKHIYIENKRSQTQNFHFKLTFANSKRLVQSHPPFASIIKRSSKQLAGLHKTANKNY